MNKNFTYTGTYNLNSKDIQVLRVSFKDDEGNENNFPIRLSPIGALAGADNHFTANAIHYILNEDEENFADMMNLIATAHEMHKKIDTLHSKNAVSTAQTALNYLNHKIADMVAKMYREVEEEELNEIDEIMSDFNDSTWTDYVANESVNEE